MNYRWLVPLALLLLGGPHFSQSLSGPTHTVWALDAGSQQSSAPRLIKYEPSGRESQVLTSLPGSGPGRALDADIQGRLYLCRGDAVHQLSSAGTPTGLSFSAPASAAKAQDVLQIPGQPNRFVVSWGATSAESAVAIYDLSVANPSVPIRTITFTWDHPRRLAATPDGNRIFVGQRTPQNIVEFDPNVATATVSVTAALSSQNIGPVGLCYDAAHNDLWVAGDYGTAQQVGCINLDATGNPYTTAFTYPPSDATGLRAPAGIFFDRFRRLYIAGRSQNGGTAGVYAFAADDPSLLPTLAAGYPRVGAGVAPSSVIDVVIQLSEQSTCAPQEGTDFILEMGTANTMTFSLPEAATQPPPTIYVAALSLQWPASCTPIFRAGTLETIFRFGGSDPRGIPLMSDALFWSTVAVPSPGPSPIPPAPGFPNNLAPGVGITGFQGILSPVGTASAIVDLTNLTDPLNLLGLDGLSLSLAWLTFSTTDPNQVGWISQPLCIKLRNPAVSPVTRVNCP